MALRAARKRQDARKPTLTEGSYFVLNGSGDSRQSFKRMEEGRMVVAQKDLLRAEDGAEFIGRLQRTVDGPRASYLVTLEVEENAPPRTESAEQIFGTEVEALTWLDNQAARRGFNRYPMVRE